MQQQTHSSPLSLVCVAASEDAPLLDGLDEMDGIARPSCIAAINTYHRTQFTSLVVCSRQTEYEAAATRQRLVLQSAVTIQPLSETQIEGYLSITGPSSAGVRTALSQEQALRELATTPLMLSVLLLTYRGASAEEIIQQRTGLERQVWTDYVTRQVQEKGNEIQYPLECISAWLSWLAQQMRSHQQTIFYAEYLQSDWLPSSQQSTVMRLVTFIPSLVIGVCIGLLVSIFTGRLVPTDVPFIPQMGVLGGFVGGCLSSSLVEMPAANKRCLQIRTACYIRNALLLGIVIAASLALSLYPASPYYLPGYLLSNWLREGCILGLGSSLSGWVFQVLLGRLPVQQVSVPQVYFELRDPFATEMTTRLSPRVWQAGAILGTGIGLSYLLYYGPIGGLNYGLYYGLVLWPLQPHFFSTRWRRERAFLSKI